MQKPKETVKEQKARKQLWYSLGWVEREDYVWVCAACAEARQYTLCDACGKCEWCSGRCSA